MDYTLKNTRVRCHVNMVHFNAIHKNTNNLARKSYYHLISLDVCLTGHLKEVAGRCFFLLIQEEINFIYVFFLHMSEVIRTSPNIILVVYFPS